MIVIYYYYYNYHQKIKLLCTLLLLHYYIMNNYKWSTQEHVLQESVKVITLNNKVSLSSKFLWTSFNTYTTLLEKNSEGCVIKLFLQGHPNQSELMLRG